MIYNDVFFQKIRTIFYIVAIYHSIVIIINYLNNAALNYNKYVERFSTGRWSLIICIALVLVLQDYLLYRKKSWLYLSGLFLISLLLGQTRTVYIILPIILLLLVFYRVEFKRTLKYAFITVLILTISWLSFRSLANDRTVKSVQNSFRVLTDVFNTSTVEVVINPGSVKNYESDFSPAGNVLWRAYIWGQVIGDLSSAKIGWLIGLPMGAGFRYKSLDDTTIIDLDPHNDYLSIISKIGILGLISYFLIYIGFFIEFSEIRKMAGKEKLISERNIYYIVTIIVILLLFVATNAEIRTYGSHFWLWSFLGFGFKKLKLISDDLVNKEEN
jgi:O-antigen ligase